VKNTIQARSRLHRDRLMSLTMALLVALGEGRTSAQYGDGASAAAAGTSSASNASNLQQGGGGGCCGPTIVTTVAPVQFSQLEAVDFGDGGGDD
jgi:hypothetical protein